MMIEPSALVAEPIVVNLSPPEVKVSAGSEPVEITAEVRNASGTVDQYTIEIENLDPSWYTVVVQSVSLFPGDSAPIPIRLHPPKSPNTRAGHHTFVVRARSNADPTMAGKTKGVVVVGSYAIFQMDLAPARATAYRGKYRVGLANGGNSDLQVELTGRDPESRLGYGFRPGDPTVTAGNKLSVPLTVKPKGLKLVGKGDRYKFTVRAKPIEGTDEEAKEVQGELVHKPPFASWKLPILILAALLLLGGYVMFRPDIDPCSRAFFMVRGIPPEARMWYGFLCSNRAAVNVQPTQVPGSATRFDESKFTSGQGYIEIRNQHGDAIGAPQEHEWYDANGVSHQRTARGQLMYLVKKDPVDGSDTPYIYFIDSEGSVFTFAECDPPRQFVKCEMVEVSPSQ